MKSQKEIIEEVLKEFKWTPKFAGRETYFAKYHNNDLKRAITLALQIQAEEFEKVMNILLNKSKKADKDGVSEPVTTKDLEEIKQKLKEQGK